jgi:hypothetical protein
MSNIIKLDGPVPLLFLGMPKCALTSVHMWFRDVVPGYTASQIFETYDSLDQLKKDYPGYKTFTIVRNPWDRAVSMWAYMKRDGHFKKILFWDPPPSFDDFAPHLKTRNMGRGWGVSTQFSLLNCKPEDVDWVFKIENLKDEFHVIESITNSNSKLIHINESEHEHYSKYYTPETRDMIGQWFKEYIDMFDYKFSEY